MKPQILLLDDEVAVHETFRLAFPEYEFVTTTLPAECLDMLRIPNRISLAVVDVVIPGINGLQVVREIRRIQPDLPVIVCTAYGSKELVIEALRAGASDYIEKPFNVKVVKRLFSRFLDPTQDEDKVKLAYQILKEQYFTRVSLDSVGRQVNMSPKYLSRKFKERFGRGFLEEKLRLRMEHAKRLLQDTDLELHQIAFRVGYSSSEAFSRAFKEVNGITPSEYRSLFRTEGLER